MVVTNEGVWKNSPRSTLYEILMDNDRHRSSSTHILTFFLFAPSPSKMRTAAITLVAHLRPPGTPRSSSKHVCFARCNLFALLVRGCVCSFPPPRSSSLKDGCWSHCSFFGCFCFACASSFYQIDLAVELRLSLVGIR